MTVPTTLPKYVAAVRPAGIVTVSTDVPEVVMVGGLNDAVAPAGRFVALSVTVFVKFAAGVTVTLRVAEPPPAGSVIQAVSSDNEKSVAVTVRLALAECVKLPLVPIKTNWEAR